MVSIKDLHTVNPRPQQNLGSMGLNQKKLTYKRELSVKKAERGRESLYLTVINFSRKKSSSLKRMRLNITDFICLSRAFSFSASFLHLWHFSILLLYFSAQIWVFIFISLVVQCVPFTWLCIFEPIFVKPKCVWEVAD